MRRLGLHGRFLSITLLGASLFAALAGGLAYRLDHERAIRRGRADVDSLIAAVENTAAIGAYAGDRVLLQEVMHGLTANLLVAKAIVTAPDGTTLVSETRVVNHDVPTAIAVERRLASPFDRREAVGMLHIEIDLQALEAAARGEAGVLALLLAGQTVLVALLVYLVAARFVSRPIVQLAARLRAMPAGTELRLQTPPAHVHDELGLLIRGAKDLLQGNEQALQRERELRAEIEQMEAQYRQIFDSSSAGIFVLDADGRLINGNPTAMKVIGLPMDILRRLPGEDLVRHVFVRPDQVLRMMVDAAERGQTVSADLELRRHDGVSTWVHCLISVRASCAQRSLIEGVMYDITERKQAESAVRHQAEHDALTGLPNRRATEAAIDRSLAAAAAEHALLSVLYIDLDGFKPINDRHGHKAGDQVLRQCAARMQSVVRRASDLIGRIGGDEFVLVLNRLGPDDPMLHQVSMQLLDRTCEPMRLQSGQIVQVGASIGIACYPRHGSSARQLLQEADAAMYQVKRNGKNNYAIALDAALTL